MKKAVIIAGLFSQVEGYFNRLQLSQNQREKIAIIYRTKDCRGIEKMPYFILSYTPDCIEIVKWLQTGGSEEITQEEFEKLFL